MIKTYDVDEARQLLGAIENEDVEMGGLRRFIWISKEFSCRQKCAFDSETCHPGGGGWHGVGSRRVTWGVALPAKRLGVTFEVHAPIYTPDYDPAPRQLQYPWEPMGYVGTHVATPVEGCYLWEWNAIDGCEVTGDKCHGDGTSLQSDVGYGTFLRGGTSAVWAWLGEAWLPTAIEISA